VRVRVRVFNTTFNNISVISLWALYFKSPIEYNIILYRTPLFLVVFCLILFNFTFNLTSLFLKYKNDKKKNGTYSCSLCIGCGCSDTTLCDKVCQRGVRCSIMLYSIGDLKYKTESKSRLDTISS
jgi:hypothetical protein